MTASAIRLLPEQTNTPVVVFGGTFDPVHVGHLHAVDTLRGVLRASRVVCLPAGEPPHRPPPAASAAHRLAMLQLALANKPGWVIDTRELDRPGPSYTVLSLGELRAEYPDQPLCLALGVDAVLGLPRWHRWKEVLALAGIVVMHRPGWSLPDPLPAWWSGAQLDSHDSLPESGGWIKVVETPPIDVAAADIRADLANGISIETKVPAVVVAYIKEHELYGENTRV
ncbi:MAG TPA: nicotinic acid mononucleotide adenylyltransferase [Gammaproteobacteria bacterium]|nr:nicotinic acid mononucleotide adenylyltransferase [Gammaproteobacteria bacterium]